MPGVISFTKKWHSEPYDFISPTRPELSAAGKNMIITGGGTGIGLAIATAFAKAGAASVAIVGRREDKLKSGAAAISAAAAAAARGTTVFYQTADLSALEPTKAAFQAIADRVDGKIDVLVANAGRLPTPGPMAGYDAGTLVRGVTDALLTLFNSFKAFQPLAGPDPILLHTSSCMANTAPTPGLGGYSVAKAAALKLANFIAAENPGVQVVNVQPGWVATESNGYHKEAPDAADLPGHFFVWLASPEAKFLKGKFVWVNWDAQELVEKADEIMNSTLLNWVVDGAPM
ncbi:NAD(P)-binding protein [Parathielavia hyrcaniae]|uniref:NAD(P)-binding protein n=1 Tax=Parathielavia hyrcaniae TaxID=113614 RepID=A0AAN6PSM3_9PEZI|nr:NAD(P)-binding protein [Parathielavia hyrcaniae]